MAHIWRQTNFVCMNLKFRYVIVLTERNVCAKNHAEILLERMFGQIGCFFSDKAICNIIGQNKKMAHIWGETNFACMNLKFKYVIVLTERNVCAKNHAKILLERMFGQIGRFFSDKAICNIVGHNKKWPTFEDKRISLVWIWNLNMLLYSLNEMCVQKITLKYCWKECLAK